MASPVTTPAVDPLRAGALAGLNEVYADADAVVYCADALALARALPDRSVDLIAPDLPYFRVKDKEWDRAWKNERAFLLWVRDLCREYRRILKPNGSLYLFASPDMAFGVERVVRRHFRVLNTIRWEKEEGWHKKAEKEALRSYLSPWEALIFAEQFEADAWAANESGYYAQMEAAKRAAFGDYLRGEMESAGVSGRDLAGLFLSRTGGLTGCVSNWLLGYNCPTEEQYVEIRRFLSGRAGAPRLIEAYSSRAHRYENAKRELDGVRLDHEAVRRPFIPAPAGPYTDVWDYPTVSFYPGKHECEKPLPLCEHIVRTSSRPGDVVLDNTCGSGQMGRAAVNLGRRVILGDSSLHWARRSADRLAQGSLLTALEVA